MLKKDSYRGLQQHWLFLLEIRDSSVLKKLPLISRALLESENQIEILESVVKSVSNIGPSTDIILKPVKFFVLERGEQVVSIRPGQVGSTLI